MRGDLRVHVNGILVLRVECHGSEAELVKQAGVVYVIELFSLLIVCGAAWTRNGDRAGFCKVDRCGEK